MTVGRFLCDCYQTLRRQNTFAQWVMKENSVPVAQDGEIKLIKITRRVTQKSDTLLVYSFICF